MANTLDPRGSDSVINNAKFIRVADVSKYFDIDEEDILAYAKAAGAVYQLSRIQLIKVEVLEAYMKHLTKVGRTSKLIMWIALER